jgi:hypothetical protein
MSAGCLDAAAASQTRTLIAIGASQVGGPRAALAELGHLDADPARVGPVDVDGLSFRGVFRLLSAAPRAKSLEKLPGSPPQDGFRTAPGRRKRALPATFGCRPCGRVCDSPSCERF